MSSNRFSRRNHFGMAGNVSFLPQITDYTSEQFLAEIIKIHENQYTPINHVPTILGRKINLLTLYNAVAKRGGFKKMNTEWSWEGVLSDMSMPIKCANASVAMRNIFQRYLEPFERLQRNKATINDIEDELKLESENRYKSPSQKTTLSHCNFNPISMVYRADTHQISSHKRQEAGLSCDLSDIVEFQKLEMSLRSGLVNEIEFSLNTILLMSFQTEGVQLCRNHRLLDLILNSVGVGDSATLKELSLYDRSTRRFLQFWNDTILLEVGRKFLLPDIFIIDYGDGPQVDELHQTFTVYDELTVYDKEGQRVQLVATIVRNLALDATNSRFITQSHHCMRLIILCCYASHFALRQLGLEILSMLAFPVVGILSETLSDFLVELINSEDRVDRLRGLEILAHLSDPKVCIDNTEFLNRLPRHLFSSLISMLIVHDLHVVVLALEAVYALSEVDSCLCTKLVECSCETLSTLYILLSLEAQVMGTQSLIRIRVMQGPVVMTNCATTNQSTVNRVCSSQSNHKQLATSLMPPPPVPTHKVPTTILSMPSPSSIKSQVYATTEAQAIQNRPQLSQKTISMVTKNSIVFPVNQTNLSINNSISRAVKAEPSIKHGPPLLTSEIVTHSTINAKTCPNPPAVVTVIPTTGLLNNNIAHGNSTTTIVTISTPTPQNHHSVPNNNSSCISTVFVKPESPDCAPEQAPPNCVYNTLPNNVIDSCHPSTITDKALIQQFTNKQDFVKSWLLSNYIEASQCTVPLFVMYKQLQVAVQNYFRDSEMVTAEEFHRLVRMLFPQVQLVQLHTTVGEVEIHYYNLKISPKASLLENLLESQTSKMKLMVASQIDTAYSTNHVPHINTAQSNCVDSSQMSKDLHTDQKHLKRHVAEMVNGHSVIEDHMDECPEKRPRTCKEHENPSPNYVRHHQNIHIPADTKRSQAHTIPTNGLVSSEHRLLSPTSSVNERHCCSNSNANLNPIPNGSVAEELKHSDSETKAFSSSTVSPIHCESLANGTDGSSEDAMDSELGKMIGNIPTSGAQTVVTPSVAGVPNCPLANNPEGTVKTEPSSAAITPESIPNKRNVKKSSINQLGRTRSRFRNNNPGSKGKQRSSSSQRPHNLSYLYICEWDSCLQSFDKPQKVYGHVYTNHFMTLRTEVESMCFWAGCSDTSQRTPLPLLNHVNEQHCNNVALESARQIRLAKEKESSSPSKPENSIDSIGPESMPKLLNFCTSTAVTSDSKSYQSFSTTQPVTTATLPQSPCVVPAQTSISSLPLSTSTPPPESITQETVVPTNASQAAVTQIHASTISTALLVPPSEPEETPTVDTSTSQSPQHVNTAINNSPLMVPYQSSSVGNPTPPVMKRAMKEGPVTKHIRFLSALILRNLCQCSSDARRFVAARHQQIFELSISGCESSRALSECLFYSCLDK